MSTPQAGPEERAAADRNGILGPARREHWPRSADLGGVLGDVDGAATREHVQRVRDPGQLFGVWSSDEHTFYYPLFQFGQDGRPHPRLSVVLAALAGLPMYSPSGDPSGWGRMDWLSQRRWSLSELGVAEAQLIDGIAPDEGRLARSARTPVAVSRWTPTP